MSRFMRRRDRVLESQTLHIPADVWEALPGEDGRVWSERWLDFFRSRDFARGKTVYAPDGSVFHKSTGEDSRAIIPVFERTHSVRAWRRSHPSR